MDSKGSACLWELLVKSRSQSKKTLLNSDRSNAQSARMIMSVVPVVAFALAFLFVGELICLRQANAEAGAKAMLFFEDNKNATGNTSRKLLLLDDGNRLGSECSKDDISISQNQTGWTGIPTYTVVISNNCASDCNISDIHVSCEWFSSARLVNPKIFRRLAYNDCLVNNGDAFAAAKVLSFQYANTFPYPLSVSSSVVVCY